MRVCRSASPKYVIYVTFSWCSRSPADSHGRLRTPADNHHRRHADGDGFARRREGYTLGAAHRSADGDGLAAQVTGSHDSALGREIITSRPGRRGHEPLGDPPTLTVN